MRIDEIIQMATMASSLLPVIAGMVAIKKGLFPKKFIPLYCFFLFTIFLELYQYFVIEAGDAQWLLHSFTIIEFLIFSWVIRSYIKSDNWKRIILISLPVYTAFWIISHLFFESFFEFDEISATVASVILVVFSVMLLRETITDYSSLIPVHQQKRYWLGAGIFLYGFGASLLLGFSNFIFENLTNEQVSSVWIVHNVLVITVNCFFAKMFLCRH